MNTGIKTRFIGQIGNQLFLYCIGKILAEKTGLSYTPPACFFRKNGEPVCWSGQPLFLMVKTEGALSEKNPQIVNAVHWYDLSTLDCNRPIHVQSGYYQRYELLKQFKNEIRSKWLNIPEHRFFQPEEDAVYIHVRRTDFVTLDNGTKPIQEFQCCATTMEEYAACMGRFPGAKRIVLITDNPYDPFIQGFRKFGLPVSIDQSNWDIDFIKLASCKWMIMSQSTFSWWAGFLGRAEKIVCPVFPGSYWGNGDGAIGADRVRFPNLFVDDDEPGRWEWVRKC